MTVRRLALTRHRDALGISKVALSRTLGVHRMTVHRWETGDSTPSALQRSPLARALQLSVTDLDRMLRADAEGLDLASIVSFKQQTPVATVHQDDENQGSDDVQRRQFIAGLAATGLATAVPASASADHRVIDSLAAATDRLIRLEQRSQYTALSTLLPGVLADARRTADDSSRLGNEAARHLATAEVVNAFVLVKLDQPTEAQTAATEALTTARSVNDPVLIGTVLRCMGETYMRGDTHDLAADLAIEGANHIARHHSTDPEALAVQGAGLLTAATACARAGHRAEAVQLLDAAARCADELRHDYIGTVIFGPTNIAIHRVAFEVELGDPIEALRQAEHFTVRPRPGLNERQARYLLDVARAQAQAGQLVEPVAALLEAESIAPEEIRTHRHSRTVLADLLDASSKGGGSIELRPLAQRCGVLAA